MKSRLALIAAVAVTAFAFVVPAALADPGLNGAPELVDAVSYFHANELATAATSSQAPAPYVDAFERPVSTSGDATPSVIEDSGSSIAWGQVGLGFGLGIVLAIGLVAAVRLRPGRPLAQ